MDERGAPGHTPAQKETSRERKQGQVACEEYGKIVQADRDQIWEAKSFYRCVSDKGGLGKMCVNEVDTQVMGMLRWRY